MLIVILEKVTVQEDSQDYHQRRIITEEEKEITLLSITRVIKICEPSMKTLKKEPNKKDYLPSKQVFTADRKKENSECR